ncbi:hypothetical protein AURDEDRAFT_183300 [Auricularia subglabra TFB-10046 SS5]|nr:hypothetical protein AURDEDRAFT_183300 [Auricularia subglabra TFB-10046 SS5]
MFHGVRIQFENIYTRITLTPFHFCFFVVIFLHCAALVFLQSVSFVINAEARDFMIHVMQVTGARRDALAVVATKPLTLYMCQSVPGNGLSCGLSDKEYQDAKHACMQISPPMNMTDAEMSAMGDDSDSDSDDDDGAVEKRLLYPADMTLIPDIRNASLVGLSIVGIGTPTGIRDPNGNLWVSDACATALRYPEQMFQDSERENVSFLFFHIWLLVISIAAITNESIPHLASALAGQCLATTFSVWDVFRTLTFRDRYETLVENTLCAGANMIPNYWRMRNQFNASIACINFGVLLISFYLSIKLIKLYSTATFRSVGSAPTIERLYRVLMAFSTILRLYLFFLMLTTALWIDQIDGGLMHTFLTQPQFNGYLGISSIALIVALPLVIMGDISMRQERRRLANGFLVAQTVFLGYHAALLGSSPIYRWTLIVWPFFALNVGAAFLLAAATLIMGVICRRNFGRGLDHYLHVTNVLESAGFTRGFMPAERSTSRRRLNASKAAQFDAVLEQGDTVKVKSAFRSNTTKKKSRFRDSTESFGHTSLEEEKYIGVGTGDSMPVFDNRAAVHVPDGAAGKRETGDV